jgi:hypothetical protein
MVVGPRRFTLSSDLRGVLTVTALALASLGVAALLMALVLLLTRASAGAA